MSYQVTSQSGISLSSPVMNTEEERIKTPDNIISG